MCIRSRCSGETLPGGSASGTVGCTGPSSSGRASDVSCHPSRVPLRGEMFPLFLSVRISLLLQRTLLCPLRDTAFIPPRSCHGVTGSSQLPPRLTLRATAAFHTCPLGEERPGSVWSRILRASFCTGNGGSSQREALPAPVAAVSTSRGHCPVQGPPC